MTDVADAGLTQAEWLAEIQAIFASPALAGEREPGFFRLVELCECDAVPYCDGRAIMKRILRPLRKTGRLEVKSQPFRLINGSMSKVVMYRILPPKDAPNV